MNLKKFYKQSTLYPGIALLIISIIYTIAHELLETSNSPYLEWYENMIVHFILAIIYSLFFGILSIPIFLNKFEKIRSNNTLSFLSWFLFPFGIIFLGLGKAINEIPSIESIWQYIHWEFILAFIANAPFAIGLIVGYRKFKSEKNLS